MTKYRKRTHRRKSRKKTFRRKRGRTRKKRGGRRKKMRRKRGGRRKRTRRKRTMKVKRGGAHRSLPCGFEGRPAAMKALEQQRAATPIDRQIKELEDARIHRFGRDAAAATARLAAAATARLAAAATARLAAAQNRFMQEEKEQEEELCMICFARPVTRMFHRPLRHGGSGVCTSCSKHFRQAAAGPMGRCPLCREPFIGWNIKRWNKS
ncbi:glutaredoxin domain-containing cysteine-rich protein 1 [uncultured Mediterranean phage]|nr:glutaredoxin domain-containing cysteine-rich protein 1 [uncultured Mediterranean phage]